MRGIIDVFAAYERAVIRARTKAALAVKKAKGEMVGKPIYGNRLAPDRVHLVSDEGEQAVIATVRSLKDAGKSIADITRHLGEAGYLSRVGKPFARTQVVRILANR